jgi:hypothetical protein
MLDSMCTTLFLLILISFLPLSVGLLSLNPLFIPDYGGSGSGLGSGSGSGSGAPLDRLGPTPIGGPCPAQALLDRLGDTSFDFGVVAVYSCPNSCTVRSDSVSRNGNSSSSSNSSCKNDGKSSFSSSGTDCKVSTGIGKNPTGIPVPLSTTSHIQFEHVVVQSPPDF